MREPSIASQITTTTVLAFWSALHKSDMGVCHHKTSEKAERSQPATIMYHQPYSAQCGDAINAVFQVRIESTSLQ
jgi:hypothetical protein